VDNAGEGALKRNKMDELIKEMQEKGLISFVTKGKAQSVFNLLNILATTEPITTNEIDWACKLTLERN
jgi:hypothetical protein